MQTIKTQQITAVILAGGRSRRMNNQDKGLIKFNQKPLVQHIIEAFENEVGTVLINANRNQAQYQKFTKNPIISDDMEDFQGPLAGFAKAMKISKTPYLLVLPCDCPMVGKELLQDLKMALIDSKMDISVAHDGDRLQPTFALLKTSLLDNLLQYLQKNNRKIDLWYQQNKTIEVDFSKHKKKFININTPCDYASVTQPSKIQNTPILGFSAFSGTGKTKLITQLIEQLKQKNIRIALVKHTHHDFEIDHPGKDSYECYHAGASQVLISSAKHFALVSRYQQQESDLSSLLTQLDLTQLDLILVEGFKYENIKKIELQRIELKHPSLFENDDNIIAIASNQTKIEGNMLMLDINNIEKISDFILAYAHL
ncbi:MAG: Molybdenum cofactor guanylyltransferase [Catillopecten margaritatus gill symbiont]|uniref:Molybdenum cofactor guanylyltransferase n=1 Tax=Catillopecten margaritatus gill symbiont TaxID=3083288 RepID=A0AAU6PFI9_9GAMM